MAFKLFYVSLIVTGSAIAQTASVSSVTPNSVPARSPSTSVSIVGTNIAPGSVVSWTRPDGNKVTITPSLIQAAQLAATIPAALLTTEGTAQVAVADPAGVL